VTWITPLGYERDLSATDALSEASVQHFYDWLQGLSTAKEVNLTALQQQLSGNAPRRPTALDAFKKARRDFQAGRRLDMRALAADLGVNRVTLYRWVGSREQLLAEILWSLTERTVQKRLAALEADPPARSRLASLLTEFVRDVNTNPGMIRFLDEEGELAIRLLTFSSGGFQPRFVALVRHLLAQDVAAGWQSPVPLDDLAFTLVRIVESYVHRRIISNEEPDADGAGRVLHALLR
jgi:AcrR family transcriptional regulator